MKQNIEIEVPDGKKAIWKDGKVVFENIKPKFPKTWEEFCEQNNIVKKNEYYVDTASCIIAISDGKRYSSSDKNLLPSKEAAKAHLALMQLHQLRDCYRQGWLPNCSNTDYIYNIYRDYNIANKKYNYKIGEYINTEYFLSFQSKDIAREFLTNFRELIEQAGDLI